MSKQVTATAKYIRGSARKTRMVAYTFKGMPALQALNTLKYMNQRAATSVYKVINSAVANAIHNENMDPQKLIITDIRVNDAPVIKRFHAESKGRARVILKRNNHVIVTVSDEAKSAKAEKPVATKAVAKAEAVVAEESKTQSKPKAVKKPAAAKAKTTKSKKETK